MATRKAATTQPLDPQFNAPVVETAEQTELVTALQKIEPNTGALVAPGRIIVHVLSAKLTEILSKKQPELAEFQKINGFKVTDAESCTRLSGLLSNLKGWMKGTKAEFELPADVFNQLHKAVTSTRSALIDPAVALERDWSGRILRYQSEQRAAEERRQREAEAEARRKAEEAARLAREEAEDNEMLLPGAPTVDPEAVAEEARQRVMAENAPVAVSTAVPMMGLKTKKLPWAARIPEPRVENMTKLLKWILENPTDRMQFVQENAVLLNTMARQHESALAIPGVEAFQGETLSSR